MSSLVRAVRQQQGMTLETLAAATGLTKSYLSKVERKQSTPSISAAMKVAQALNVDVAQLFSEDPEVTTLSVDRAHGRSRERYQPLAPAMLGKAMSPFVVRPTREFAEHTHSEHSGQEFIFVHTGSVEIRYGEQTLRLDAGDSAYFDSTTPHRLRQIGTARAEVVVVTYTGR